MVYSLHSHLAVFLFVVALFNLSSSFVVQRHENSSFNSARVTDNPAALHSSQRQSVDFGRYAFDRCTQTEGCAGDRWCLKIDTFGTSGFCGPEDTCICDHMSKKQAVCNTSKDCVAEEGCVRPPSGVNLICMSCAAAKTLGYSLIENKNPTAPSPDPSTTPSNCTGGHLDHCNDDSDCRQSFLPARCYGVYYNSKVSGGRCYGVYRCACLQGSLRTCEDSRDCECGESCIIGITGNKFCGSRQIALKRRLPTIDEPTPSIPSTEEETPSASSLEEETLPASSTEEPAPCISIDALQHIARKDLILEHDRLANVLCHSSNSCATAGHMVSFKERTMMMGSYCEIVGCQKRVMHVNSTKWRRRLKVGSKNEGMVFLASAARYGTTVEEAVLSGLVRAGL